MFSCALAVGLKGCWVVQSCRVAWGFMAVELHGHGAGAQAMLSTVGTPIWGAKSRQ